MPQNKLSTAIANPIRTGVQIIPSVAITEFVDAFLRDMDDRQYAALVVILTLLFSWAQNGYENFKGRGFLREVAQPTAAGDVVEEVKLTD